MQIPLSNHQRDWSSLGLYFTVAETDQLRRRWSAFQAKNYCFCSFENRFAKSGGLAAVTSNILPFINATKAFERVVLMTPFYSRLTDSSKLQPTGSSFSVPFAEGQVQAELVQFRYEHSQPKSGVVDEYYIKANGFFESQNTLKDPYLYHPHDPVENQKALVENSLFFCQAVPYALQALALNEGIVLHLQEWQTALLALTSKQAILADVLQSCLSMITMHNPYDAFISYSSMQKVLPQDKKDHIGRFLYSGATAYQIGLPLTDAPITTVSQTFAQELTSDILHTVHFAPHLQSTLVKNGVEGVNNGLFVDFSQQFPKKEKHSLKELAQIKLHNRHQLLNILETYHPAEQFGDLTWQRGPITGLPDEVPILVMSGRLDPGQKGYDVLLNALEKFNPDEIKVILTPMPIRSTDLDYFYEIACKCRGNVTVFPIRMSQGFTELQTGSTFGLMPSIYEPFGAAVEYMANGTVTIARETGGLVDQIEPGVTGFLYREPAAEYNGERIKSFMSVNIAQVRKQNPWFIAMSASLSDCLRNAIALYRKDPTAYYRMVQNGFRKAAQFSWSTSADQYIAVVRQAAELANDPKEKASQS